MQPTDPDSRTAPDWALQDPTDTLAPTGAHAHRFMSTHALAVIVGSCVVLFVAKDVFLPLALGMLFAFILTPVVNRLCRWGMQGTLAVVVTVSAAATLVAAFVLIVAFQLSQIGVNLPQYQDNILGKMDALLAMGSDNRFVSHLQFMVESISSRLSAFSTDTVAAPKVEVIEQTSPMDWLTGVILPAFRPIGLFGLVFVLVTFALLERDALRDRLVQLIGGANILTTSRLLAEAGARVSTYLVAQVVVNIIYAVPIWLGLSVIGVPNALFFGMVTLVARFLPYIGAFISALLPVLMALAVSPDWSLVLWTVALFLVVEFVTSNAIEPWFYGHRTGLSPLAVIVSAMFWTWLWGPLGLFLATPLTVCLVVVGYHVPGLRLFSILFGDKPALEEPARLYDRLLAGRAHATTELGAAGNPDLSAYYNQILIPALMLAEADHEAGLLSDLQIARIAKTTMGLMEDLETIAEDARARTPATEAEPPPQTQTPTLATGLEDLGTRVAIVGSRTRLDEVAARLLARELVAAGTETIVLPDALQMIDRLRTINPSAIVIVSLGGGQHWVSALQLRQLRRRFPKAQVVVAIWPGAEGKTAEAAAAGGDYRLIGGEAARPRAGLEHSPPGPSPAGDAP